MKVLLAIDSSLSSEIVTNQTAARPWPPDTTMCVLTVVDTHVLSSNIAGIDTFARFQVENAEALANSVANRLKAQGIEVITVVQEGYPQKEILDYAQQWDADLILLGSHGHSRLARFFMGSTSQAVVRNAPCSVEIIRSQGDLPKEASDRKMRILLATDGSEVSDEAVRSVANRPWPEGTTVKVVSVFDPAVPLADPGYIPADIIDRIHEENRQQSLDATENAVRLLKSSGLDVNGVVLEGEPKSQILDEAKHWDAHLIVVGSHGRRGITRFLMGSVSETVAQHAPCSVEVIRQRTSKLSR